MTSEPAPGRADAVTPPSVSVDIGRASLREYWLARAAQHTHDSYAGIPMSKFPEDLRAYEHLLWLDRPDTVIELGVHYGGGGARVPAPPPPPAGHGPPPPARGGGGGE